MRTVVRHLDSSKEEFDADGVAFNQQGLLVLVKADTVIATFVPQNIVGVIHPDGPPMVQIPEGKVRL